MASQKLVFLRRNLRGFPYKLRELIYATLVKSSLEYCGSVWDTTVKGKFEKLGRVQKRAARWARVPVASFLLLLYWMTLAGPVWRTDSGTNVCVYFINFWTDTLKYHHRNLSLSLQPVEPRPHTTRSCRDYQGRTSTPCCGGPPFYIPFRSGTHYLHLQPRPTLLPLSSVGWPPNHSAYPIPPHQRVASYEEGSLARAASLANYRLEPVPGSKESLIWHILPTMYSICGPRLCRYSTTEKCLPDSHLPFVVYVAILSISPLWEPGRQIHR